VELHVKHDSGKPQAGVEERWISRGRVPSAR
jgi:hypothetical protein